VIGIVTAIPPAFASALRSFLVSFLRFFASFSSRFSTSAIHFAPSSPRSSEQTVERSNQLEAMIEGWEKRLQKEDEIVPEMGFGGRIPRISELLPSARQLNRLLIDEAGRTERI
jgi:hypothetical protein